MPHEHTHNQGHHHSHSTTKNIGVALALNLVFAVIELIGGLWTNSVAILSDAIHDFGDSLSLGVAWRLQKVSERGADANYSYGYRRFSLLGALFISVVLLVGSVFIVSECIERINAPQTPNAQGMLWLALLGVAVNGAAMLRLRHGSSLSERAVMLHFMEDILGWMAVLVVSIVMLFVEVPILDPLLSIGISAWVLFNVFRNLRATFKILLQHTPPEVDRIRLESAITALPGVDSIHDLHLWSLDGEHHVCTLHVVTEGPLPEERRMALKQAIRQACLENKIGHATIEFEVAGEECLFMDCEPQS